MAGGSILGTARSAQHIMIATYHLYLATSGCITSQKHSPIVKRVCLILELPLKCLCIFLFLLVKNKVPPDL
jgi:hypothetical protein